MSQDDPNTSRPPRRGTLHRCRCPSLAGCGSTIKPEGAAQSVVDLVSEKTDFKPNDVKCPDGIKAEVGVTLDCNFTGPDGDYVAHMKILEIKGDTVQFDIKTELAK